MSTAEETAAALRASKTINESQQAITDESRVLLIGFLRNEMRDELRIAVAEGVSGAMTDANAQKFVRSMWAEAQKMAAEKSVEVAGGAIKALLKRALLFLFLGSLVYAVGGWSALAALAKFLASRES
jgi:hypothetical protein